VQSRLLAEAELMQRIDQPLVPVVHDVYPERMCKPYFTMDLIEGTDLCSILRRLIAGDPATTRRFPLTKRVSLVQQIARGLESVHRSGVIHRDIKPENIMVDAYNRPRLIDWGIALSFTEQELDQTQATLERSSVSQLGTDRRQSTAKPLTIGTPRYMPPEQIDRCDAVGPAADIFALGAVLHDCLALQPMIQGHTVGEIFQRTVHGKFDCTSALGASVPKSIEPILRDAVAVDWVDRYASMADFAESLNQWLAAKKRPLHVAMATSSTSGSVAGLTSV
jgi:serine/threonine-protein kinase